MTQQPIDYTVTKRELYEGLMLAALLGNPARYEYMEKLARQGKTNKELTQKNINKAKLMANQLIQSQGAGEMRHYAQVLAAWHGATEGKRNAVMNGWPELARAIEVSCHNAPEQILVDLAEIERKTIEDMSGPNSHHYGPKPDDYVEVRVTDKSDAEFTKHFPDGYSMRVHKDLVPDPEPIEASCMLKRPVVDIELRISTLMAAIKDAEGRIAGAGNEKDYHYYREGQRKKIREWQAEINVLTWVLDDPNGEDENGPHSYTAADAAEEGRKVAKMGPDDFGGSDYE